MFLFMILYLTWVIVMEEIWLDLYYKAKEALNSKELSPFITLGTNACAIRTVNGNIYTGINIDTSSNLNSCAERSAVTNMINHGEKEIDKIVIVNELEEVIKPCKKCLSYLLELSSNGMDIEILIDIAPIKINKLYKQLPNWWGTLRIKK